MTAKRPVIVLADGESGTKRPSSRWPMVSRQQAPEGARSDRQRLNYSSCRICGESLMKKHIARRRPACCSRSAPLSPARSMYGNDVEPAHDHAASYAPATQQVTPEMIGCGRRPQLDRLLHRRRRSDSDRVRPIYLRTESCSMALADAVSVCVRIRQLRCRHRPTDLRTVRSITGGRGSYSAASHFVR